MQSAKITVTWDEAKQVAGHLKVRARSIEALADTRRARGGGYATAASLDAFADKLLAPFLQDKDLNRLNQEADHATKGKS
ncbi:MAG: hypothetical protein KIT44_06575 [Opitutaceae bacterium]|nr:hypothetical protein [Opitutaceae bacterium]